jgi:hypothetical protein
VLVVASLGRDSKLVLSLQKDSNNDTDTAWSVGCPDMASINNDTNSLKIENLNDGVTINEL